jgi:hypothetical protein
MEMVTTSDIVQPHFEGLIMGPCNAASGLQKVKCPTTSPNKEKNFRSLKIQKQ